MTLKPSRSSLSNRSGIRWWIIVLLVFVFFGVFLKPHLKYGKSERNLADLKIYPLPSRLCLGPPYSTCFSPRDEPEDLFEQIAPFCPLQCNLLDVGANKGDFLSRGLQVLPHATFIAFEPHPYLASKLETTYANIENVEIHNVGLSTSKGNLKAVVSYLNSSAAYQSVKFVESCPTSLDADRSCMNIPVLPLDDVVSEHINLMKIDVQGHELDVLLGSLRLLGTFGIDIIISEVSPSLFHSAEHARTYLKLLSLMNYKIFALKRLDPHGFKKSVITLDREGEAIHDHSLFTEMAQKGAWMDVLCINKELIS